MLYCTALYSVFFLPLVSGREELFEGLEEGNTHIAVPYKGITVALFFFSFFFFEQLDMLKKHAHILVLWHILKKKKMLSFLFS